MPLLTMFRRGIFFGSEREKLLTFGDYLTLRFESEDRLESTQFLVCLVDTLDNSLEALNKIAIEYKENGAQITHDRLEARRVFLSEKPKQVQARFWSERGYTFGYIGAVLGLIFLSAAKVSVGVPPV